MILTRKMKRLTKNNIFKVKIPFVTKFNKEDVTSQALTMLQYGVGSKLELFAIKGYTPCEVNGILLLENDILGLDELLTPLQSSHTTSGDDIKLGKTRGRPPVVSGKSNEDKEKPENTSADNNTNYKE